MAEGMASTDPIPPALIEGDDGEFAAVLRERFPERDDAIDFAVCEGYAAPSEVATVVKPITLTPVSGVSGFDTYWTSDVDATAEAERERAEIDDDDPGQVVPIGPAADYWRLRDGC